MKRINLGGSGLEASTVALGCMRIAGLDEKELDELIFAALEAGIDLFDHADIYGGGNCEERFGEFLRRHPETRSRMLLQSKCAIRSQFYDFSGKHIIDSVEGSLRRLRAEYLDVLLLHRPDTLMEPEEVAHAFTVLHQTGKVRHFGVSNHNPGQIALLQKFIPFRLIIDQVQFGPAYTPLVDTGLNVNIRSEAGTVYDGGLLEYCRLQEITLQSWGPFRSAHGMFPVSGRDTELYRALERIGGAYGLSVEGAAVAWITRHPARIQTVIGTTNPERAAACCKGADAMISREEWYEIYRAAGNRIP